MREHIEKYQKFDGAEARRLIDLCSSIEGFKQFFLECYRSAIEKRGKTFGCWVDSAFFHDEIQERMSAMMPFFGFRDWKDHLKIKELSWELKAWGQFCRFIIQAEFAMEAIGFVQRAIRENRAAGDITLHVVRINIDRPEKEQP